MNATTERIRRGLTLVLPLAITAAAGAACVLVLGWRTALDVFTAFASSLFLFGTTTVFGAAVLPGISLSTWHLAAIVSYASVFTSFVYAYNMDLIERIPRVGPFLHRARAGARASVMANPWIRRMATVGVGLFVLTPLPGSGSLGGTIVGHLVGLTRLRSFLACSVAGVTVAFVYALAGEPLRRWLDDRHVGTGLRVGGAVASLVVIALFVKLVRRFAARVPKGDAQVTPE